MTVTTFCDRYLTSTLTTPAVVQNTMSTDKENNVIVKDDENVTYARVMTFEEHLMCKLVDKLQYPDDKQNKDCNFNQCILDRIEDLYMLSRANEFDLPKKLRWNIISRWAADDEDSRKNCIHVLQKHHRKNKRKALRPQRRRKRGKKGKCTKTPCSDSNDSDEYEN